jgi:hypothetical protein
MTKLSPSMTLSRPIKQKLTDTGSKYDLSFYQIKR